jgi:adenylate cyclase
VVEHHVVASRRDADALLRRAEADADLLYAAVRTLVLAALWALYLASADGHHHDDAALAGLVAYTALAAFTWYAVWRDWRSRHLAVLTVSADVVLVVAQLVVIAAQAGVPPAQLFALPPATLVFLVIAHAALRFRTGLVLYAGVALTALILAAGALPVAVEDVASSSLHHHASAYWQALPLAVLLLTTAVLWFVARRTRALLDTAIAEAQRAARLARFFSPTVARRLAEGGIEGPLRGSRHDVAVLFIDIHGFTAMAERMRPEELGPFLGEFRGLVTRCVFACGGTVDKFLGDGALAVFGATEPRPDAAACALGCAEAVLTGVEAWSSRRVARGLPPVEVAIGAHHGEAYAGIVGSEGMLEFTVLGDTVNVGERLHRVAVETRSDLVVSEAFRRVCGDAFPAAAYHSLGLRRLSGRSEEVEAWARRASPAMPAPAALEPPAPLSTRGSYVGHGPRPRRRQRSSPRPR